MPAAEPDRSTAPAEGGETTSRRTVGVDDASAGESDGVLQFTVKLVDSGGGPVTVSFDTEDGTARAGHDYEAIGGTLTFVAESAAARQVEVPIIDDPLGEQDETVTLRLSDAHGADLAMSSATGTIVDDDGRTVTAAPPAVDLPDDGAALELAALEVSGGRSEMYPAFDASIRHYGVRCGSAAALQVRARSRRGAAQLTLLRADENHNVVATGSLDTTITAGGDHDVAVALSDDADTVTYVIHCISPALPDFNVLTRAPAATDGLLFVTLDTAYAIVDYNGVPRFHAEHKGRMFRPHADGPLIDGRRVHYSVIVNKALRLLDSDFEIIRTVTTSSGKVDDHDVVLGTDSYLFISRVRAERDFSEWDDTLPTAVAVKDSVITELFFAGTDAGVEVARWNSWDHLKIVPDCQVSMSEGNYANLNSLQVVEGDVIASLRGCAQVVRIDRSGGTWEMQWKLGGSDDPRNANTEYLEIVGDPLGEFCGQHQATLTDDDRLVLFDNGNHCLGPRKDQPIVTRVVEYDLSSGTQASFVREYRRPAGHGYSEFKGGATILDGGNWLIAWGGTRDAQVGRTRVAHVSEVDRSGDAVFHLNMYGSGRLWETYRVYHDYEDHVSIPLNLP